MKSCTWQYCSTIVIGMSVFLFLLIVPSEAGWQEDYAIDKRVGIANRTWRIKHIRRHTVSDLSQKVKTAFQPYKQPVERAQEIVSQQQQQQ